MNAFATANSRRTTLIVAVVLALGAGWLTLTYLSNLQRQSNANSAPVQVVVAAQEIPARVTITSSMLTHVSRPASVIDPGTVTDPKLAVGALSLITIPAGASISQAMIGHPSDVGLPVRLQSGMRAVSIQIDKVKGVSGLIEPGDRVDVIADPPKGNGAPPPAAAILRGVRVMAIGQSLENTSATPSPQEANSTTVTLEVTPKQADMLVMADINTTLRLSLRSPKEPVNSEPVEALHFPADGSSNASEAPGPAVQSPVDAMTIALRAAALHYETGRAPAMRPIRANDPAVTVIDGDHYSNEQAVGSSQR